MEKLAEASSDALPTLDTLSSKAKLELPFYSKYLLIAAYLASYNPAKVRCDTIVNIVYTHYIV